MKNNAQSSAASISCTMPEYFSESVHLQESLKQLIANQGMHLIINLMQPFIEKWLKVYLPMRSLIWLGMFLGFKRIMFSLPSVIRTREF